MNKWFYSISAAILFAGVSQQSYAQAALTTGIIADQIEDTGKNLINEGFDRLDQSMVNAGVQLQSIANSLRLEYESALDTTITSLEGAQKTALQNSYDLVNKVNSSLDKNADLITSSVNQVTTPLYSLLGGKPRIVNFVSVNDAWEYDSFELTGKGVALSNIKKTNVYVGDKKLKGSPTNKDDTNISFRVKASDWAHVRKDPNKVTRVPVKAEISFCKKTLVFFCRTRVNTYNTEIILFPEVIGNFVTHYTHVKEVTDKNKKCSPTVTSDRAQTKVKWDGLERGTKNLTVNLTPDKDYRFITDDQSPDKPTKKFEKLNSGCHGSSSTHRWSQTTDTLLQLVGKASTDRKVGATCKVSGKICGHQIKTEKSRVSDVLPEEQLTADSKVVIDIPGDQANFSHIEVKSVLFKNGSKIFQADEKGPITMSYRPADQKLFVSLK